jgi:N-methylhydantoinase A/oxoprolinase/acetone carboxylase beta subunit
MASFYRVGVDVGGTNTDAVVIDITASDHPGRGVLASYKTPTTTDITSGIEAAIAEVLKASGIDKQRVLSVNIGTTHFINALIEADSRRLDRVAVIRLCGPFTRQLPPLSDVPDHLRDVLDGGTYFLDGGLEIDGRIIANVNKAQIIDTARNIVAAGAPAVAVVGVFSPVSSEHNHEEECKRLINENFPQLKVVCSHSIGPIGLLERENATILNAAILDTAGRVTRGFKAAMRRLSLGCPLYLSQNDGTLIDVDTAAHYPIKTFASGPTNSMIGAAFLSGLDKMYKPSLNDTEANISSIAASQILVVDIGGTTTDVCALLPSGFPRPAPGFVEIGGVRTAFSIPEVASIGLGGGSVVNWTPLQTAEQATVTVGPSSVGHAIQKDALAFGGHTLTATDVVIAAGKLVLGDAALTRDIPLAVVQAAQAEIKNTLEVIVDKMKVSRAPVHVLLVGGGAVLAPETLQGVEKCTLPPHSGAANAVGAAIAKVCGEVDVVEMLDGKSEDIVVREARTKAIDIAVKKGALYDDVEVVEVNKMPLQYTHKPAIRIQVKAVGRLATFDGLTPPASPPGHAKLDDEVVEKSEDPKVIGSDRSSTVSSIKPSTAVSLSDYRPDVRNNIWHVSEVDLELIATGCGVLGTGGGGPTHYEYMRCLTSLRTSGKGKMQIVSPTSLNDDDLICSGAWYGSPSVLNERIGAGTEIALAMDGMKRVMGGRASFQALLAPEM